MIKLARTFYITTAIDYVNGPPHIGHAYEKICADAIARWHRLKGEDVFFLTGTDENAQKNAEAAKQAGIDTKEFVDKNSQIFVKLCKQLNISNNDFIRTTEKRHTEFASWLFKKIYESGDIYKGEYEGLYCQGCEAFITEKDLVDGKCPEHNTVPKHIKEENYFFKLSKYADQIKELIKTGLIYPESYGKEILSRLEAEELRDLCVSRKGLDWGIKTPIDSDQTIYVWIDALSNYISALGYESENFRKYWPADAHVIGKGINWFHSVIWPALLLSAGIPVPKNIVVHGYVSVGTKKISKSTGNFIDPVVLTEKYGADALRYYLLREIPFGGDSDFSEKNLIQRNNSELADSLGNLVSRTVAMINKYRDGKIPAGNNLLASQIETTTQQMDAAIQKYELHHALEILWSLIAEANKFVAANAPWELAKDKEKARDLDTVLYTLSRVIKAIADLASPFIPESAEKIKVQIDNHFVKAGELVFPKFESEENEPIKTEPAKNTSQNNDMVDFDYFKKIDLRVAEILEVEDIEDADKLYKLKIKVGDQEKTIVAGIKTSYSKEELKGKKIVVVNNLKPAELRGITSEGMLLAVGEEGNVTLLSVDKDVESGLKVK